MCRRQAQSDHITGEYEEPGEFLSALGDTELSALLDCVDGVTAGVGKADDLGLG